MDSAAAPPFDTRELRQVLGTFVTGVTVITTLDAEGRPQGLTANSFSSVSLDPPLILWSQSRAAPSHPVFRDAERFAVNILADDQVAVSNRFARGGADKFSGIATRPGLAGVPLIEGCAAWLECRRIDSVPGGDHVVFIGQVERIERTPRASLVFGGGRYLVAQPHDMASAQGSANLERLKAVRLATRALAELSDELDVTLGLGVWGNHGPTMVRWEESSQPLAEYLLTGFVLPVLSSATGLAFATWLPAETTAPHIDAEMSDPASVMPATDAQGVQARLDGFRAAGLVRLVGTEAFAEMYRTPIDALSVPVFDGEAQMVLALTAIAAAGSVDIGDTGRLASRLRDCAATLSQRLGAAPPAPTAKLEKSA